ncbi:hypothetical protein PV328_004324 [Microctonus aethiopoides]|uniref:Uncharacterized protein n=1 Tax=Microctonus aethiopoides TaxID=144406 RepID=A0AA39FAC0_9HYME|nr:hypothetical protein PV328_004324 [Microctonus aethiopoides]
MSVTVYRYLALEKSQYNQDVQLVSRVLAYDTTLDELEQQLLEISTHHREQQQQQTMFFSAFAGELESCCKRRNKTDHKSSTDITDNNDANEPLNQVISFTFDDHDLNNTAEPAQQQVIRNNDDHPIFDTPRPAKRVAAPQLRNYNSHNTVAPSST